MDKILDHKRKGRGYQYKVQWAHGQGGPTHTWEPGRNLRNAQDLLNEYNDRAGLLAGTEAQVGANVAFVAHQIPVAGDSVVLSDGLQALVHSVDGDTLHVQTPMNGSRSVHASSVHKTPTWREEALALDDTCFQGSAVSEVAFSGPRLLFRRCAFFLCSYPFLMMVVTRWWTLTKYRSRWLLSPSQLSSKEENELDYAPGLFVPAKVNEMMKLFRFKAVEAVRMEDFHGQVLDARFVLTFKPGYAGDGDTVLLFDQRLNQELGSWWGFPRTRQSLEDMSSPTPLWSSVRLVGLQTVNHGCLCRE